MVFHPRDGRDGRSAKPWERPVSRRRMIQVSASTILLSKFMIACGDSTRRDSAEGADAVKIGTPDDPIAQPLFDDNPPIESGLGLEAGPLQIYNWADYLWTRVVKDFEKEYGVDVEVTTFYNMEEATRKLRTGQLDFDLFFPTAEVLPKFVAGKLLQPLNHDYLPNFAGNVWPNLQTPYYDVESAYTVPYTAYTTGIAWRVDVMEPDVEAMANPWELFWDPEYAGLMGLYDDFRESIGVGLYKTGNNDINSGDQAAIEASRDALLELTDSVNIRYTIDGSYSGIPESKFGAHHSWNGDIIGAQWYFPKGEGPEVLRYAWPPKVSGSTAGGYVSNDMMGVVKGAKNPVLAHTFMNYLLDHDVALKNFSWLGYQPPLNSIDPTTLVGDGYVPESVANAIIEPDDFNLGQQPVQLSPDVESRWLAAWSEVQAG